MRDVRNARNEIMLHQITFESVNKYSCGIHCEMIIRFNEYPTVLIVHAYRSSVPGCRYSFIAIVKKPNMSMSILRISAYHGFDVCHHRSRAIAERNKQTLSVVVKRTKPYFNDRRATRKCRNVNVAIRGNESRAPSAYADTKTQTMETVKMNHPEKFGLE